MTRHDSLRSAAVACAVLLAACAAETTGAGAPEPEPAAGAGGGQAPSGREAALSGTVIEAVGAAGYTYLRVETGHGEKWLAAPELEVAPGDRVSWPRGTPMRGWHSETLDRTWDVVDFVGEIRMGDAAEPARAAMPPGHPPVAGGADSGSEPVARLADGLTVAEVHARSEELTGEQVTLRARVVKANFGILGSNWLHLQDGSGDAEAGTHDLTVTTAARAAVGDVVVVAGKLATDRDFGAGYRYAVIVEDAELTIEPAPAE